MWRGYNIFSVFTEFRAAYIYNKSFVKWQSTKSIQYYQMMGRDYAELATLTNPFGDKEIDISKNYGRKEFYFQSRLMVSSKMYFNIEFFPNFLDNKKLRSYSHELNENILSIFLETLNDTCIVQSEILEKFWFDFDYESMLEEYRESFD